MNKWEWKYDAYTLNSVNQRETYSFNIVKTKVFEEGAVDTQQSPVLGYNIEKKIDRETYQLDFYFTF